MTKPEARKLSNGIVDYFCKLVQFERRQDITISVNDCDINDTDYNGTCDLFESHGMYHIKLIVAPYTTPTDFIGTVCHELAHVFTNECYTFYRTFVAADDGEIAEQVFTQGFERIAKRLAVIFAELWSRKASK